MNSGSVTDSKHIHYALFTIWNFSAVTKCGSIKSEVLVFNTQGEPGWQMHDVSPVTVCEVSMATHTHNRSLAFLKRSKQTFVCQSQRR